MTYGMGADEEMKPMTVPTHTVWTPRMGCIAMACSAALVLAWIAGVALMIWVRL